MLKLHHGICQAPELSASQFADWSNLYQVCWCVCVCCGWYSELYMFDISELWSEFHIATFDI